MSDAILIPIRPLGYERVYLPLYKVADTPFHIYGDEICTSDGMQFVGELCTVSWKRFTIMLRYNTITTELINQWYLICLYGGLFYYTWTK